MLFKRMDKTIVLDRWVSVRTRTCETRFFAGTMEFSPDFVTFSREGGHLCIFPKSAIERIHTEEREIEVPSHE